MLTVFWDRNGVIMTDFFPQQQRVGIDGSYYAELIRRLRQHSREKRPDLIHRMWRLLHDNAPINSTPEICVELHRNNFEVVPHPPYKPDLAPSDYHLFKNLKSWQRGRTFANQEEMEREVEAWIESTLETFYSNSLVKLIGSNERYK